jgi:hypothetical protein
MRSQRRPLPDPPPKRFTKSGLNTATSPTSPGPTIVMSLGPALSGGVRLRLRRRSLGQPAKLPSNATLRSTPLGNRIENQRVRRMLLGEMVTMVRGACGLTSARCQERHGRFDFKSTMSPFSPLFRLTKHTASEKYFTRRRQLGWKRIRFGPAPQWAGRARPGNSCDLVLSISPDPLWKEMESI